MAGDKTSMGMEQNVAGLLCYIAGWITGLIFYLMEKDNRFVRFHAMQSILVTGALTILGFLLAPLFVIAPFLALLMPLFWVVAVVLWILLMVKAYQNQWFKLPWAGDFAEKHI